MLPVNVILPEDDEQMALTVNGKKRNIRRNDFLKFAESAGIARDAAVKMLRKVVSMREPYIRMCGDSVLPDLMKARLCELIEERTSALESGPHTDTP